jgi:hypothetical protein
MVTPSQPRSGLPTRGEANERAAMATVLPAACGPRPGSSSRQRVRVIITKDSPAVRQHPLLKLAGGSEVAKLCTCGGEVTHRPQRVRMIDTKHRDRFADAVGQGGGCDPRDCRPGAKGALGALLTCQQAVSSDPTRDLASPSRHLVLQASGAGLLWVLGKAAEGFVMWCGWHDMQGVRGSMTLPVTTLA